MGLSTKKTKTTTAQNTTANLTPTNPDFVTQPIQGLSGRIEDTFKGLDPYSLVPGANSLQTQAASSAAGLGFGGTPAARDAARTDGSPLQTAPTDPYGDAMTTLSGETVGGANTSAGTTLAPAASLLTNLDAYKNPFLKDVRDASLADYNYGAGLQEGQANLDLAGDTTFGGSGGSIYKSLLGGEIARGRGSLSAGLNSDAFDKATQLSLADAGMRQQTSLAQGQLGQQNQQFNAGQGDIASSRRIGAAGALSDVAGASQATDRANIDTQSQIGEMLRQIQAARAGAPVSALGMNADLLGKLPFDLFKGSNATGSLSGTSTSKESGAALGDWLNMFAANASAAAKGAGGG